MLYSLIKMFNFSPLCLPVVSTKAAQRKSIEAVWKYAWVSTG